MKRKAAVIVLCVVFLVGTFYVFASDALVNQEDKTDVLEIAETAEPAESAEPESTAKIVIETSPDPDSEIAEPTASAAAEDEDLSGQTGENETDETDKTASQYPSNFYELAQVLNNRDINTAGVCDVLTSYLYLRDVYGLSNQELEYIAGLIIGGAEPSDIMEAAYFWLDTCEDISII